jgi:antitoxin component YwqK of YwqJK toxin-antitoxin module
VVLLSLTTAACSSGDTKPTEDGVLTAVYDDGGAITGYERRYHNDNGDVTRLDVYDAEKNYQSFEICEYNDDGLLYTRTYYRADGIAVSRDVYSYDDAGTLSEIAHENPHGDATVDRYDKSGNIVEKLSYDTEGQLERRLVLEDGSWVSYDAEGNILQNE